MTADHVLTHSNGVAEVYDEVLPFFAAFAEETVALPDFVLRRSATLWTARTLSA